MTLEELIQDLHALELEIQKFEKKYNILSEYFYKLFQAGKLEHNKDFTKWAGFYEIKLKREQDFKKLLPSALASIETETPVSEDFFQSEEKK